MAPQSTYTTIRPNPSLRDLVSHYWVSPSGSDGVYTALPDGAIDLVFQVHNTDCNSWVYGTPTARIDIPLQPHCSYFGIRFKPGQNRHFMQPSARDLTDNSVVAHEAMDVSLNQISEALLCADGTALFDELLKSYLNKRCPEPQRIDDAIRLIEARRGVIRIREVADMFGQSRRQFERVFLETVGVSAKTFATITRFQHTVQLLAATQKLPLSHIAAELDYVDQSHMSRDFKRLAGITPSQFAQGHVAFLQDIYLDSDEQ